MGTISKLAQKCQNCPNKDRCSYKYMELCAYNNERVAASVITENFSQSATVKHDYRSIKVSETETITIDMEEMKKQLEKDFYKSLPGFNFRG